MSPGGASVRANVGIVNVKGLHARASAKFCDLAARFDADVWVTRDRTRVNGIDLMELLMLGAGKGSTIVIEATGPEADAALSALVTLVENRFDEKE